MSKFMEYAPEAIMNLFRPPVTTTYPVKPATYPERSRGHVEIEVDDCIGCSMCVRCCPSNALAVNKLKGTWTINRFDCVACGYCVEKCPKKCLQIVPGYQTPEPQKAEATYTKSPEVLAEEERKRKEAAAKAAAARAAAKAKADIGKADSAKAKADIGKADSAKAKADAATTKTNEEKESNDEK